MAYDEELSQRIQDCGELYLKHRGKRHELIEREMRKMGHTDFHRRCLYRRFERGTCQPGWIETYGWDGLIKEQHERMRIAEWGERNQVEMQSYWSTSPSIAGGILRDGLADPAPYTNSLPDCALSTVHSALEFDEFKEWLKVTSPEMQWEFKHQVYLYKRLKKVTDGECRRLMIFMPPRHGKSEMVTVRYAAWRLKQDPSMNVILASHTQQLANRFSRKIKRVLCDDHALNDPSLNDPSLKGTKIIAQGKALGRDPGYAAPHDTDPEGVEQPTSDVAPFQGAEPHDFSPGVTPAPLTHPRLLPSSPSATRETGSVFPFASSRPKNTEAEWETTMGGGLRAVGVGSGVTGFGANLIIIDDPVKSRAEAESKTFRERLWNWFNDDIRTRLEPDGSIVLIQTRWHEDDLAGRLLREAKEEGGEQWTVVNLPALAEMHNVPSMHNAACTMHNEKTTVNGDEIPHPADPDCALSTVHCALASDPLGRTPNAALWPERFPEPLLDKLKRQMGTYAFASLYQQRPTPAEGGLFKRKWFKIVNTPPPNLKWARGYDLGISKNATADYTASMRIAFDDDKNMYIDGGYRARIEYPEQRRYILGRINSERDTHHGIELSANGNAVIQDLRKSRPTQGRAFLRGLKATGDKITHALPWIALAEEGRVHLVRGPWNRDFIEEAAAFPLGTHDDQIDAVSLALRLHRERGYRSFGF